jgi:hypothetical protein
LFQKRGGYLVEFIRKNEVEPYGSLVGKRLYAAIANVELPDSAEKFYFKNRGCGLCDGVDNVRPIELILIPGYAKDRSPVEMESL